MTHSAPFAPTEIVEGDRSRGMLLVADHAGRALPHAYGRLGLPEREFERHIAYDIGVEPLTRALAARLAVPAVMATFSRLLIDTNRGEDDPTLIRQLYDGTIIRANYPIDAAERQRRLDTYHRPYHDAVSALTASVAKQSGVAPFIVSLHSFTPAMQGRQRPWHVGILWDSDDRAPRRLIDMLAGEPDVVVGDNEPYDGALRGDTMYRHAIVNGYAHALIELRQDLIADPAGVARWAGILAPKLEALNAMDDMHVVRHCGSRTGPVALSNPTGERA